VIEGARKELRAIVENQRSIRYRLLGVQASIPPSAEETSLKDLEGEPDAATELRTVIANGIENCLNPLIADLDAVAGECSPERVEVSGSASLANLDLGVYTEATRRALYELVVAEIFGPTEPAVEKSVARPFTPDQAGLEVVYAWGRWFAVWWKLELPATLPEAKRREILRLEESKDRPGTLAYRLV
jgi:hypothetical protein